MKIHFSAEGMKLTGELERYANRKLARLAKKVPRRLRAGAVVEVMFVQRHKKGADYKTCVVSFQFDDTLLKAEETTLHMYAALDIAAVHMERQLVDYATKHRHPIRARLRRYFKQDW